MERRRKLLVAKCAVVLAAVPLLIWAYEYGPNPGFCGVPREFGTCVTCHTGVANNPANKGSVSVSFPNGLSYTPGVKQHLTVTIADPATSQLAWGFQLTVRTAADAATMAGNFASSDSDTLVMCSQPNLQIFQPANYSPTVPQTCPASETLRYIEHSLAGYVHTMGTGSATYQFDWTPPATDVGRLVVYVAGNAGHGGVPTVQGDHVYTANYALSPAAAAGNGPAITGVISGASFQPGIVPDSWIAIQGTNLSSVTDTWANAIVNGALPTTLDGVSVSVGGKPAYVYYVSPTQINVLAPDVGSGSMSVTVTNAAGTSAAATANSSTLAPAFFLWVNKYAVATRQDFSWAVANGTFSGVTTTPAKPGDVIILWGTGFGPTNPAAPVGMQVPASSFPTASPVTVTVGGTNATVYGAALAPGFAGLYQVAIQIPTSAPNGDLPVVATINGAQSPATTLITVQQ